MTVYSIRTSAGNEIFWTSGRGAAFALAAEINEVGFLPTRFRLPQAGKRISEYEMPVAVYRCSAQKAPSPRTSQRYPGGVVAGVPAFNPANVAYVEETNR